MHTSSSLQGEIKGSVVAEDEPALQRVTPGEQVVSCFYATPGSLGETILEEIVDCDGEGSSRFPRTTIDRSPGWMNGVDTKQAVVEVSIPNGTRPITRTVTVLISNAKPKKKQGVVEVADADVMCNVRGYARFQEMAVMVRARGNLPDSAIRTLANQLIADYVVHGRGWSNKSGRPMESPYGPKATRTHS